MWAHSLRRHPKHLDDPSERHAVLKDQLLLLLELEQIDSLVLEARKAMEALPARLAPAQQDLAKLEAMLQQEKDQLADTEKWRREQEAFIQDESEALKQAKIKLQAAKNTRDYAAASREVDHKRRSISDREEEVLKVIEAIEKSAEDIVAHDADVETLRQHVGAEETKLRSQLAELETQAGTHAVGRDDIVAKIPKATMKRYERTLANRGTALAPVVRGVCQGCHMTVPPQLNNTLARLDSVEICPQCKRILYRKDALHPDAEE